MTIKEIAQLAGVSISTVSKIVNEKDHNINPQTRERVLKIVKEYNYTPYGMVKTLSNSKTFLLGVLLKNASKSFSIVNGILETAQKSGYHILLLDSQNDTGQELKHLTALCKNKIDGLLWEPVGENSAEHLHYLEEQNIDVCFFNAPFRTDSLQINFEEIGYMLTQKLIEHKHTKLACFLDCDTAINKQILDGFQKCLYEHQISYRNHMDFYPETKNVAQEIINRNYSGILCSSYASALSLYEQMNTLHYTIPSDLSLICMLEDHPQVETFPHICGIRIPYHEFGCFLCEMLIQKCEKTKETDTPTDFLPVLQFQTGSSLSLPPALRTKKLVVVGSINIDQTFNVDLLPQAGRSTTIRTATTTAGGKGANQAVGASKLGREVALIGQLGNDTDASFIFDTLEKSHVLSQGVHRNSSLPTGKAYIYIETSGESTITILPGANNSLTPEIIQNRQHLFEHAGYCLISSEIPVASVLKAAITAHEYGAKTILKPAALHTMPEALWQYTDIFVPNRKEAATLCPSYSSITEQAEFFFARGIETVIITLGHEGCYLKTADNCGFFPAADFSAIDATGGADAFICALASYLIEGYSLEKSIRIATYAAGFCISRQSVVPALVDRNTLETYIAQNEPDLLK